MDGLPAALGRENKMPRSGLDMGKLVHGRSAASCSESRSDLPIYHKQWPPSSSHPAVSSPHHKIIHISDVLQKGREYPIAFIQWISPHFLIQPKLKSFKSTIRNIGFNNTTEIVISFRFTRGRVSGTFFLRCSRFNLFICL